MISGLCRSYGWLLIATIAQGAVPPDYYRIAEGKTGPELRRALHLVVSGHRVVPYSLADTSDALMLLDQDPDNTNNVILIYSGYSVGKTNFGVTTGWNREHLWPNSYGLDNRQPAFSDLHNLRAVDWTVNSSRGNKLYDESDRADPEHRVPGYAEAPMTSTDSDSWEAPDQGKGDIARALFYMAVRYTGDRPGEPALFLTDRTSQVQVATNLMARLTTLLVWHAADPVDDSERLRNDRIFEHYQRNRNPFVDRPEWALEVFAPRLEIERTNGETLLRWPAEFTLPTLETASTPSGPWEAVTNIAGVQLPCLLLISPENRYFRLIAR